MTATDDIVLTVGDQGLDPPAPPMHEPDETRRVARATGNGLAARLQAGVRRIEAQHIKEFPVPGWNGELVLRARKMDRQALDQADTELKTIALATDAVLVTERDDAPPAELSWRQVGDLMGLPADTPVSNIVLAVFGGERGIGAARMFSGKITAWMAGLQADLERLLGE